MGSAQSAPCAMAHRDGCGGGGEASGLSIPPCLSSLAPAAAGRAVPQRPEARRRRRGGRHDAGGGSCAGHGDHPCRRRPHAAGAVRAGECGVPIDRCLLHTAPRSPAAAGDKVPPSAHAVPALTRAHNTHMCNKPPPLPRCRCPQHGLDRLPVVDAARRCVGILTRSDFFWTLVSRDDVRGPAAAHQCSSGCAWRLPCLKRVLLTPPRLACPGFVPSLQVVDNDESESQLTWHS